jgi:hypothetical protein
MNEKVIRSPLGSLKLEKVPLTVKKLHRDTLVVHRSIGGSCTKEEFEWIRKGCCLHKITEFCLLFGRFVVVVRRTLQQVSL